jgi:hypothetical protein
MQRHHLFFGLLLFLVYLITKTTAQVETFCPGCDAPCVGDDGGPCCSQFFEPANKTYCAPYCLVTDYTCCGCIIYSIPNNVYDCFGCPSGTRCVNKTINYPPLPYNQTGWYCAAGSQLHPSVASLFMLLAALTFCFVMFTKIF